MTTMERIPFILYRIIGNPLPPRHDSEDTYSLLRLILENEPDFPGCEKRWILNRFTDHALEERCGSLIESHGQKLHCIPFPEADLRDAFFDYSGLPPYTRDFSTRVDNPSSGMEVLAAEWITRHKSRVLININGARNEALRLGVPEGRWILPLDGWSYFTPDAWKEFTTGIEASPDARYAVIPLVRMTRQGLPTPAEERLPADDEPQLAFRHDAPDRFDDRLRYGNRNKTELLDRLGYEGFWTPYRAAPWEQSEPREALLPGRFSVCGRTYRLKSGPGAENDAGNRSRSVGRIMGVMHASLIADAGVVSRAISSGELPLPPDHPTERKTGILAEKAGGFAKDPPEPIIARKWIPSGGTANDFCTVYPLPDSGITPPVLPILAASGYGEGRDRLALRGALDALKVMTEAGIRTENQTWLRAAADLLFTWFLDPRTRMNPAFEHAGLVADGSDPSPSGLLELKDLWILPRIASLLKRSGHLDDLREAAVRSWCSSLLSRIVHFPRGEAAYHSHDVTGTWTHLLALSLCLHARHPNYAARLISSLSLRLVVQCRETGVQPFAFSGAKPLFLSLFNVTGWVFLADMARSAGFDFWKYRGAAGESLCMMLRFLQAGMDFFPESAPGETIDHRAWLGFLIRRVPPHAADASLLAQLEPTGELDEIPPEWGFLAPVP